MIKGQFTKCIVEIMEEDNLFRLHADCTYTAGAFKYTVKAGYVTDFGSIPFRLLRRWLKRNGKSRVPSLFHDHMITTKWKTREQADRLYKQMLIAKGETRLRINLYFAGVSIGRWWYGDYADER